MSNGLIVDGGSATQQEMLIASAPPNAKNVCGVVFARTTLHGSYGDIYIEENSRLFCPPEFSGVFGTFKSSFKITGGTSAYSNLIGRGKGGGTFTVIFVPPSSVQIVVHTELEGQASFVK